MAWQVGVLSLLLVQTTVSTTLQGQIPGIKVTETASDCGSCTGKLEITLPDGVALPLEIELKENKKIQKKSISNNQKSEEFIGLCPGEYELTFTALTDGFKGLTCAKKTVKGTLKGGVGEASFTVNLVSNANQRIEVSTNATNPIFAWSTGGSNSNVLNNAPPGNHTVTVTDAYGCKKTAGPFAVAGGCYDASGKYIGTKFDIVLEQVGFAKPVLINMYDPITLQVKINVGGSIQAIPPDYTIAWKLGNGQVVGTEKSLLITPGTYATYQAQSLSVTIANACETRQIPIKLQPCSGADPQVLKEIFTTTTTPSCKAANNVDLKTGSITVTVPLPLDGVNGVSVYVGSHGINLEADPQKKKGTATWTQLASGPHLVKVGYGYSNGFCSYSFTVDVPAQEPDYKFIDFVNGQCNFTAICNSSGQSRETKVSVPPARIYTTRLFTTSDVAKSKCQPKVDCILGKASATRLNGPTIDAIRTYAGIFEDVIHTVLSDPNNQLTAKEREALDKECQDNKQRFDCRVIKFCPGSFTVVDDGKPPLNLPFALRKHNHDITTANCRELSCGKGGNLEVFSTCDPKLKEAVNITSPQGPNGGICNTPPPKPDEPEDEDDSGNTCQVWKKKVPLSQIYYNEEYRSNPFYQGSQINQIIDALDTRIQAVDAITKRGDAKERFLLTNCIQLSYCETNLKLNSINFSNVLNTIKTLECSSCEPTDKLTLGQLMVEVKRGTRSVLPGSDLAALVDEFNRVNTTQDENQMVSRYACVPVPICAGDYIKNIDVVVQQMKARVNNACPTCSASIFIQMPLNKLVALFKDGDPYSPTSEFAKKVGKPVKAGGQLEKIISECGGNHGNPNNKNCISILFCVDDPSQSVYDFANVKLAACSQYCPKSFHEHEISLHPNDQELVVSGLGPNDELPPVGKYFQDTLMVVESFKTFASIVSDGSISPKAITQTAKGNFYYNYSHDVSRIHNIKDSTLLFRHEDWDNDNYWFVDAAEGVKNEFIVSHNQDTYSFAAPLESDSLLHFTHFTVRDSFLYLSGYYTGALRYRAELVDDQPTHAQINGFVLRINQQGDLRGAAIIENIDTTLNGFRVALGKTGDVLVAGKVKSSTLRINQSDAATGLIGGGFVGTLHANTHAFSLLNRIDLEANAQILRAAVEPNQAAYALLVSNTNGVAQQAGGLQVGSGNKVAALSLTAQGALQWVKYFNGNIDPRQLDITFGVEQRLNVGITYAGNVSVDSTQYFSSLGKQDIGLIQFDQQGQYRWHRSYGSPETETVVELLYDAGILYFGGNFTGAQGFRSVGGYDFYNPTPFHERAYVSYYADSIAVDSTLANTPELAALSAPVLQKSSTPDRNFKVFPNPFKDEILAEFESQTSENMSIDVLNELGRVIKTQGFEATPGFNRQQISTQQFPAGIYFIYLRNQAGQVLKVQKLVKM